MEPTIVAGQGGSLLFSRIQPTGNRGNDRILLRPPGIDHFSPLAAGGKLIKTVVPPDRQVKIIRQGSCRKVDVKDSLSVATVAQLSKIFQPPGQSWMWALAFPARPIKIGVMETSRSLRAMQHLRQEKHVILPSLLLCDFGDLKREIGQLEEAGVKALHLDVMDGHFVPNLTYGMPIVAGIRKLTNLPIDVHLMISEPSKYIRQFAEAGADCLTIHAEIAEDVSSTLEQIRSLQVGVGLALNPDTALTAVEQHLPLCDLLLIMSVNAGFGGQAFNPVALEKLSAVKASYPDLILEVDGGVNLTTIASCQQAGASLFVVGSAIFGQSSYRAALEGLAAPLVR